MKIKLCCLGIYLWGLLAVSTVGAVPMTYYDVDFSSPTHTLGSTPTVGSGIDTPSSILFGQPIVESSLGALTDQALVFNTTGNTTPCCFYDQIELDLGYGADQYQVSFDLSTDNFVNTGSTNVFSLMFDTPEVRSINFFSNGTIGYHHPFLGNGTIGSFVDDSLLSMMVDIDLLANTWDIFMNDSLLFGGAFNPSGTDIGGMRLAFGGGGSTHDSVGIDNILVTNGESIPVPAPSVISLLVIGLVGLSVFRRRHGTTQKTGSEINIY